MNVVEGSLTVMTTSLFLVLCIAIPGCDINRPPTVTVSVIEETSTREISVKMRYTGVPDGKLTLDTKAEIQFLKAA